MSKPGPAKGTGGRPRKPASKQTARPDGYKRQTVGPKGKGKRVYAHRAAAGVTQKGSKGGKATIVHHKGARSNNAKSSLKRTTRAAHNKVHAGRGG